MTHRLLVTVAVVGLLIGAFAPTTIARGGGGGSAAGRTIHSTIGQLNAGGDAAAVTGNFVAWDSDTGIAEEDEFAGEAESEEDGAAGDVYSSNRIDRSLSVGAHTPKAPNTNSTSKAKSHPQFQTGFAGLNHYQQRYSRGGNQFSLEPPDQALCVGNGYILEATNDVLNIFNSAGHSVLPDNTATNIVAGFPRDVNHAVDLNSFYGYAPAINRATGVAGPFITDPTCVYDAATGRFFLVVLTLDTLPNGAFTHGNHLDLAVSDSSNPTGSWSVYQINVIGDGSNSDPDNACPCLGDYPHIGADAYNIYLTTNAYPWEGNGFAGAQVYAVNKWDLAAGTATAYAHFDTYGTVAAPSDDTNDPTHQPGFTVWPAQSPGANNFNLNNGGTEYFLSSNAADEAKRPVSGTGGNYQSSQIVLWTLTNASNLASATLGNVVVSSEAYSLPPRQQQPGTGTVADATTTPGAPVGDCLNDSTTVTIAGTGCWRLLVTSGAHTGGGTEQIMPIDSNDTRMQQVSYANGKVWGALDTGATTANAVTRAGIAWFIVNPSNASIFKQGYLANTDYDFTYPAIGVTASGRGVMAFTATGGASNSTNPSAAYAALDAIYGLTAWNIVPGGEGARVDDGFSGYKQLRFPLGIRPRWGDYGAAAVDGNSVWLASEFIQASCDYTAWGGPFFVGGTGDNLLGTCGGASHGPGQRTALANWSTFISKYTP